MNFGVPSVSLKFCRDLGPGADCCRSALKLSTSHWLGLRPRRSESVAGWATAGHRGRVRAGPARPFVKLSDMKPASESLARWPGSAGIGT